MMARKRHALIRMTPILAVLLVQHAAWADVRASFDRNPVYEGDTVNLIIETDGQTQGAGPDLGPLEKDFNIVGTSTSTQIQIINGRRSDTTRWIVELEPGRTGEIRIPGIEVGGSRTPSLTLRVTDQPPEGGGGATDQIAVEVEVQPGDNAPYVQQQVHYIVRLYTSVPLLEGSLSDPPSADAVIERLGEDGSYQTTRNGRQYRVIERHYAIFPEKSGELAISPVTFRGRIATPRSERSQRPGRGSIAERFFNDPFFKDPFFKNGLLGDDFFAGTPFGDQGRRVRASSRALTLDVKPRPASYTGKQWLPSEDLVVRDSWAEDPPRFRAGEPVSRTITIEAKGLAASQLPEIKTPESDTLRTYNEQPVITSRTDGDWVYGQSKQTMAYVAPRPGKVSIPGIRLTWWDTSQDRQRVASLPGWEMNVLPGSGSTSPATAQSPGGPSARPQAEVAAPRPPPAEQHAGWRTLLSHLEQPSQWLWVAGTATGLLLIAFAIARRRRRSRAAGSDREPSAPPTAGVAPVPPPDAGRARRAFQQACLDNRQHDAARTLLEWAGAEWPDNPPRNLGALANRLESGGEGVRELDRILYAPGEVSWDGKALWEALKGGLRQRGQAPQRHPDSLAPLYPQA